MPVIMFVAAALILTACGDEEADPPESSPTETSSHVPTSPVTRTPEAVEMPDVVGRQVADAIEVLEAMGISDYRVDEQASLRSNGEVLTQVPSADTSIHGTVILMVAGPLPPMPDYAGRRVGDARSELEGWGVAVVEEEVLSDERPTGEVVDSVPAAGDTVGSEVILRVAVAPVVGLPGVDVAEVEKGTRGEFWENSDGPVNIDGELYERSLSVDTRRGGANPGDLGYWEYNLGRDWESFESVMGVLDDSDIEQAGRFRIILDGSVIFEQDIRFGQTEHVSINVSNGLRLRLEAVSLENGRLGLGWGDARLLGIPGEAPTRQPADDD